MFGSSATITPPPEWNIGQSQSTPEPPAWEWPGTKPFWDIGKGRPLFVGENSLFNSSVGFFETSVTRIVFIAIGFILIALALWAIARGAPIEIPGVK